MQTPNLNSPAWNRNRNIRDGICRAIYDRMKADSAVYLMGEGAHMKVHFDAPMIEKDFSDRVITLPISEDGNTNFAVGMAIMGMKPINDVIQGDFLYRAMDSICNTAAKLNYFHRDDPKTLVIRAEWLLAGPTTGQRTEALFAHIPGLNVVVPSNPIDAYGLMSWALTNPGITIFFEDRMIKDSDVMPLANPVDPIPFGKANTVREGTKLTLVSYGLTLRRAQNVIDKYNYSVDLIDLRTLFPLDIVAIHMSLSKTKNNLLIVEPDVTIGGIGSEIVSELARLGSLPSQPLIIGMPRITIPSSSELYGIMIPTEQDIREAIEVRI